MKINSFRETDTFIISIQTTETKYLFIKIKLN